MSGPLAGPVALSTLLSNVPEDILYEIIALVLLAERAPPPDLSAASQRRVPDTHWPSHQPRGVVGRFADVPYRANDLALKLASRRLASLTAQVLSQLRNSGRLLYVVDVAIVNEQELWPTWLCVPSLAITTDLAIHAQFRLLGARKRDVCSAFHYNGSPRLILYGFYYLLEHALRRGPLLRPAHLPDRLISAKTLEFSLIDAPQEAGPLAEPAPTYWDWLDFHDEYSYEIPPDVIQVMPQAEWFRKLLMEHIEPMLRMEYHHSQFGAILHERVASIAGYDVGDYFGGLPVKGADQTFSNVNRDVRVQTFWKWKMDALALRRELGLPIRDPIVMPPEGLLDSTRSEEAAVPAADTPAPSLPTFSRRFSRLRARVRLNNPHQRCRTARTLTRMAM